MFFFFFCITHTHRTPRYEGFVIKFMKRKQNQNYNKIRLQPLNVREWEWFFFSQTAMVFLSLLLLLFLYFCFYYAFQSKNCLRFILWKHKQFLMPLLLVLELLLLLPVLDTDTSNTGPRHLHHRRKCSAPADADTDATSTSGLGRLPPFRVFPAVRLTTLHFYVPDMWKLFILANWRTGKLEIEDWGWRPQKVSLTEFWVVCPEPCVLSPEAPVRNPGYWLTYLVVMLSPPLPWRWFYGIFSVQAGKRGTSRLWKRDFIKYVLDGSLFYCNYLRFYCLR